MVSVIFVTKFARKYHNTSMSAIASESL